MPLACSRTNQDINLEVIGLAVSRTTHIIAAFTMQFALNVQVLLLHIQYYTFSNFKNAMNHLKTIKQTPVLIV